MDVTQLLPYVAAAAAHPLGKYLVRQGAQFVRARQQGITTVELKRIEARTDQENRLIDLLSRNLEQLEAKVSRLEGRIEGLEHEKFMAYQKLAASEAEVTRLNGVLADRDEYIAELERDHAAQAEKIDKLTTTIADRYRAAGA
jgi:chromosome segregation ATPase